MSETLGSILVQFGLTFFDIPRVLQNTTQNQLEMLPQELDHRVEAWGFTSYVDIPTYTGWGGGVFLPSV